MNHLAIALLLWVGWHVPLRAQIQPEQKEFPAAKAEDFKDVAADLRCPTCTGLSVLDSDAPFSVQIKNEVKEQLVAGKEKKEILKFFTDRYGPWILREPPKEGIHLWAWIVPMGILLLGPIFIGLIYWVKRSDQDTQSADEFSPQSVEDIVADMNSQLEKLRGQKEPE